MLSSVKVWLRGVLPEMRDKDRKLLLAKLLFFCVSMSTVGWQRFQNNFYLDNGLQPSQIGALKSIGLFFKFFAEPILCFLADIYNSKIIFVQCLLCQIMTIELMRFLPKPMSYFSIFVIKILRSMTAPSGTITTSTSYRLTKGTSQGFGQQRMFGSLAWGAGAFIAGSLIDKYGMGALFTYSNVFNIITLLFVLPLPSAFMTSKGASSENKASDSTNLGMGIDEEEAEGALLLPNKKTENNSKANSENSDDRNDNQNNYDNNDSLAINIHNSAKEESKSDGRSELTQRSPGLSNSGKQVTENQNKNVVHLRQVSDDKNSWIPSKLKSHIQEQYQTLLKFINHRTSRIVLFNVFISGIVMTVPDTYLYIALEKSYGASRRFSGFCTTVSILSVMPLFWYSDALIKRFGHFELIYCSQLAGVVRLFLYFLVPIDGGDYSLNLILMIQLMHGFHFALFWAAVVDLIYKISPKDLITSCLSTVNIVFFTLAAAVGNLICGPAYDLWGPRYLYLLAGLLCLANAVHFRSQKELITVDEVDKNAA